MALKKKKKRKHLTLEGWGGFQEAEQGEDFGGRKVQ